MGSGVSWCLERVPLRVELLGVEGLWRLGFGKLSLETLLSAGITRANNGLNAGMQLHMTPILISIVLHEGQPWRQLGSAFGDKPPYEVFRIG